MDEPSNPLPRPQQKKRKRKGGLTRSRNASKKGPGKGIAKSRKAAPKSKSTTAVPKSKNTIAAPNSKGTTAALKSKNRKAALKSKSRKAVPKGKAKSSTSTAENEASHIPFALSSVPRTSELQYSSNHVYVIVPPLTEQQRENRERYMTHELTNPPSMEVEDTEREHEVQRVEEVHSDFYDYPPSTPISSCGRRWSGGGVGGEYQHDEEPHSCYNPYFSTPVASRHSQRSATSSVQTPMASPFLPKLVYPMPSTPTVNDHYFHALTEHMKFLTRSVHTMTSSLIQHGFMSPPKPSNQSSPREGSTASFNTIDAAILLVQWGQSSSEPIT